MGIGLFCLVVFHLYHQKISFECKTEIYRIEKNFQLWNKMASTQPKQAGLLPQKIVEKLSWDLDTNSDTS